MILSRLLATAVLMVTPVAAFAVPTTIDLSTYVRVGRFNLPEPTRTTPPTGSLLAQEASAVTFNRDTNSLFIVGDGSTSVVQVSKTGQFIDSMTLAQQPGAPQGTAFYDLEGLAYVGQGQFVFVEERYRQANLFTYTPGTTLQTSQVQIVDLGTDVGNVGIEDITTDPLTGGFVAVKEENPLGIFQTTLNFAAGTASNGSATTVNSTNLFNPALLGLTDFAGVFALSNLPSLTGTPDGDGLLVLSQVDGRVVETSRIGVIRSSLTITADAGDTQTIANKGFEGIAMDDDGILYLVNEEGGGSQAFPQLWVYAPATVSVPEPASAALLLAGLGLAVGWRSWR